MFKYIFILSKWNLLYLNFGIMRIFWNGYIEIENIDLGINLENIFVINLDEVFYNFMLCMRICILIVSKSYLI